MRGQIFERRAKGLINHDALQNTRERRTILNSLQKYLKTVEIVKKMLIFYIYPHICACIQLQRCN